MQAAGALGSLLAASLMQYCGSVQLLFCLDPAAHARASTTTPNPRTARALHSKSNRTFCSHYLQLLDTHKRFLNRTEFWMGQFDTMRKQMCDDYKCPTCLRDFKGDKELTDCLSALDEQKVRVGSEA